MRTLTSSELLLTEVISSKDAIKLVTTLSPVKFVCEATIDKLPATCSTLSFVSGI